MALYRRAAPLVSVSVAGGERGIETTESVGATSAAGAAPTSVWEASLELFCSLSV
jgi:hypothetical protein